ncbi:hypothetical protein JHK86_050367 [Glycine max]|nr:hypothetical protein JHK86_050367 [Glycine max]
MANVWKAKGSKCEELTWDNYGCISNVRKGFIHVNLIRILREMEAVVEEKGIGIVLTGRRRKQWRGE